MFVFTCIVNVCYKCPRCNSMQFIFLLLQDHSTCFGRLSQPSSGVRKTVVTDTGTSHISRWVGKRNASQLRTVASRWTFVTHIATKCSRNVARLGITLFSGTFYLILTANDALLCHFALHCTVQESNPTVQPGFAEKPTIQRMSCVSLLLCLWVAGKWQHWPRTGLFCYETKNV